MKKMSEQNMYDAIKPEKVTTKRSDKGGLIIVVVAALIVLVVAAIMCYYFLFKDKEVVATYDGGEVTRGEYELYYRTFAPMLVYYGYPSDIISKYIAEKIILDKIILNEAQDANVTLTDEQKAEVDELFEDKDSIQDFANRGIDIEKLKELFYNDSLISSYIEQAASETTAETLKAYILEEEGEDTDLNIYGTRHILFSTTSATTDEEKEAVKKEAEEVLARVKKGEDFATLADEFSDDTYTQQYSDGVYEATTATTVSAYVEAAATLTPGQYTTSLVEDSSYGYFIIKLDEIKENGRLEDEDEKTNYVESMLYQKQDEANCQYDDERITEIATSVGTKLGLISSSTSSDDTDLTDDVASE